VSHSKTNRAATGMAAAGRRARDRASAAAAVAVPAGKRAGTTALHGARRGVRMARGWAAPRLEDAADAVTRSVAPKVSSALRSTARRVRPAGDAAAAKAGRRRLLDWRLLGGIGAALAAAGATAAVTVRRRYARATAQAKSDIDAPDDARQPDAAAPGAQVNGRVSTPGT
jgi:hypothetical protein